MTTRGNDTQAKFIRQCEAMADKDTLKIEMVHDRGYANTGTIRWEHMDGFSPILTMTYDFQTGYVRVRFPDEAPEVIEAMPFGRRGGRTERTIGRPELAELVAWLADTLTDRYLLALKAAGNGRGER